MSIDYKAIILFGKEFDSFDDAAHHLLVGGQITEEEAARAENIGEFKGLDWQDYSYIEGGAGVLGCIVTAEELWLSNDLCGRDFDRVLSMLGDGCDLHTFVQVS